VALAALQLNSEMPMCEPMRGRGLGVEPCGFNLAECMQTMVDECTGTVRLYWPQLGQGKAPGGHLSCRVRGSQIFALVVRPASGQHEQHEQQQEEEEEEDEGGVVEAMWDADLARPQARREGPPLVLGGTALIRRAGSCSREAFVPRWCMRCPEAAAKGAACGHRLQVRPPSPASPTQSTGATTLQSRTSTDMRKGAMHAGHPVRLKGVEDAPALFGPASTAHAGAKQSTGRLASRLPGGHPQAPPCTHREH
jgi:hypothetical protein